MNKIKKVFTTEFKQECMDLVISQGYGLTRAALAMNAGLSSMQRWISRYRQEVAGIAPKSAAIICQFFLIVNELFSA